MISWSPVFDSNSRVPFDNKRWNAVEAGSDDKGAKLYVGRGKLQGGTHVGKIHEAQNACFIPLFGNEHKLNKFEVLSVPPGVKVDWVAGSNGQVPPNAVEGGHNEDGTKTYIGRIQFNGTVTPGEISPNKEVCYIAFMGKEEESRNYEVLVVEAQPIKWITQKGAFNPAVIHAVEGGQQLVKVAGFEGEKLYIGRSLLDQGCHVGKVRSDVGTCYVPFQGKENTSYQFQVLSAPPDVNIEWVAASNGDVPDNAVEGGFNKDKSKTFVGRTIVDGVLCPGEVAPSDGKLYIAHQGEEIGFEHYEVLVLGPPCHTYANPSK